MYPPRSGYLFHVTGREQLPKAEQQERPEPEHRLARVLARVERLAGRSGSGERPAEGRQGLEPVPELGLERVLLPMLAAYRLEAGLRALLPVLALPMAAWGPLAVPMRREPGPLVPWVAVPIALAVPVASVLRLRGYRVVVRTGCRVRH